MDIKLVKKELENCIVNGYVHNIKFNKLDQSIKNFLEKKYPWCKSGSEYLYCIKNNINSKPKCKYCNNEVIFSNLKNGYKKNCTKKQCKNKAREETNLEKYGVKNISQNKKIQEKKIQTSLSKYGTKNPMQSEIIKQKLKQTNLEKYGVDNPSKLDSIQEKLSNSIKKTFEKRGNEIINKRKQTNLEKYGVDNPLKLKEIREKIKQTNLEKYGVEHPFQSEEIKKKVKLSILKKYGVDNISKLDEIKEKIKQTNLEKYGVEYPAQSKIIREKIKQTNLEKYGVEHHIQNKEIKCKIIKNIKQTNLEKYGVEHPFQSEVIQEKIKKTIKEKYGVEHISQSEIFKEKLKNNTRKKLINKYNHIYEGIINNLDKYLKNNRISASKICKDFDISYHYIYTIWNIFNIPYEFYFGSKGISKYENEILSYIESLGNFNIVRNSRKIINPFELDIYLPEFNFAIEFNGLYHHSTEDINKINELRNYHLRKTELCEEKGIHLFHIFENEWINPVKQDIWKSKIAVKLNKINNKINARNCKIKEINSNEAKEFLETNHLQGYIPSKIRLGLFYKDELVSIMTFGKNRFKKDEYELYRFASKKYTIVRGAFSKLIKYFIRNYKFKKLISYANRRWTFSKNNVYQNLLKFNSISNPNYFYVSSKGVFNRIKFQKHKLKNILEFYDENLSEFENVLKNGYRIIFDSGNIKYILAKEGE